MNKLSTEMQNTKNSYEWGNISSWYARSTVRNSDRVVVSSNQSADQFLYPVSRQIIAAHPLVESRGRETVAYVLAQSSYRYMYEIGLLETRFVIDCSLMLINGEIGAASESDKLEALAVVIDEGYHAYVALDFIMQIKESTGIEPIEVPYENENLKAVRKYSAMMEGETQADFYLIACTIAEHTLTKDLLSVGRERGATESFSQVMKDHVSDEGRHASYFARMMRHHWKDMSEKSREKIGQVLPAYLYEYLSYDKERMFERKILLQCGLDDTEVNTVLGETYEQYIDKSESYINTTLKNIVALLKRCDVLEHEPTQTSFLQAGMLQG